jgi:hypothetical protein
MERSRRYCHGKTPMEASNDALPLAKEEVLDIKQREAELTSV